MLKGASLRPTIQAISHTMPHEPTRFSDTRAGFIFGGLFIKRGCCILSSYMAHNSISTSVGTPVDSRVKSLTFIDHRYRCRCILSQFTMLTVESSCQAFPVHWCRCQYSPYRRVQNTPAAKPQNMKPKY